MKLTTDNGTLTDLYSFSPQALVLRLVEEEKKINKINLNSEFSVSPLILLKRKHCKNRKFKDKLPKPRF